MRPVASIANPAHAIGHCDTNAPSAVNFWMRSFPVSPTYTPPSGPTAIVCGRTNWPAAEP
jgi:hypothetical protein